MNERITALARARKRMPQLRKDRVLFKDIEVARSIESKEILEVFEETHSVWNYLFSYKRVAIFLREEV